MEKQTPYKKRKIILAITKSNFGGAQKYVYMLAKNLKNKGFWVKVLLGGGGYLITKLQKENIEIIKIKTMDRNISFLKDLKTFLQIYKILKKEKPEILHLNSSKIGFLGSIAGRFAKINKIIFTTHGFAFNENRNFFSKEVLKMFYWIIFVFSHKTIFVSKTTKKQAPKFLLSKTKFKVIYNGIEKINFLKKEDAQKILIKKNNKLKSDKIWIGTLSELHHIKGIDKLIISAKNILKKENNVQFIIFGDGEEKENLNNKIKKLKMENDFILFGQLENASKYLKALNLFVLPSRSEGMPFSILEAMQAKIPIVASNVGGIKEILPKKYIFKKGKLSEKILKNLYLKPNYKLDKFDEKIMASKTKVIYNVKYGRD